MLGVIDNAIAQHPRTMAVRVDLRLPDDNCNREGANKSLI
nr:inovirus-type Gp2 protein [Escherichia coli]